MELFVVVNKSNEVVQRFSNKQDAKTLRNSLQAQTKNGIPGQEEGKKHLKDVHFNWDFRISCGKDHFRMEPRTE